MASSMVSPDSKAAKDMGAAASLIMQTMLVWIIIGVVIQLLSGLYRLLLRLKAWWYWQINITVPQQGRE